MAAVCFCRCCSRLAGKISVSHEAGNSRVEHATRVLFSATRRKRFAACVQTRRTSKFVRIQIGAPLTNTHASGVRGQWPQTARESHAPPGKRRPPTTELRSSGVEWRQSRPRQCGADNPVGWQDGRRRRDGAEQATPSIPSRSKNPPHLSVTDESCRQIVGTTFPATSHASAGNPRTASDPSASADGDPRPASR